MAHEENDSSMSGMTSGIRNMIVRFAGVLLALTLLATLWSTALARLSERSTAVELLTRAGTDIINPLLTANGSGLGQALYQQLEAQAKAHPHQALALPFLKVQIPASSIVGKDFAAGSAAIYRRVAEAYYDNGPDGAFLLPDQLKPIVSSYTPFVQNTGSFKSPLPSVPIPQLPSFLTQLWYGVGFTPTTLTAAGHATTLSNSGWLWGVSAILVLVIVLFSAGWNRLRNVAWPLFHSSWHIALFGVIGTFLTHRDIAHTGPYAGVLDLIGGTFMPVFYAAVLVGLAGVVVSFIGQRVFKPGEEHHEAQREPAYAPAAHENAPRMSSADRFPSPQANLPPPEANYPPSQSSSPPQPDYGARPNYGPQPEYGPTQPMSSPQQGYGNPQPPFPNPYPSQQGGYGAPDEPDPLASPGSGWRQ
jgi:hypothetical protein